MVSTRLCGGILNSSHYLIQFNPHEILLTGKHADCAVHMQVIKLGLFQSLLLRSKLAWYCSSQHFVLAFATVTISLSFQIFMESVT